MSDLYYVEPDGTVVLSVYVQPSASRDSVVGRHGGALKVRVTAPPVGGEANLALVRLVASELGMRRADVEVSAGASKRSKRLRLRNVSRVRLERWLDGRGR